MTDNVFVVPAQERWFVAVTMRDDDERNLEIELEPIIAWSISLVNGMLCDPVPITVHGEMDNCCLVRPDGLFVIPGGDTYASEKEYRALFEERKGNKP